MATGKQLTNAFGMRDLAWDTWTCPLGWPVRGIFAPESDGNDVNAVARSRSGRLLVTADDHQMVKLFRFPVLEDSDYLVYQRHQTRILGVDWLKDDAGVVTVGGADSCVFQWRVVGDAR